MAMQHTVAELRDLLRHLRSEIEKFESIGWHPNARGKATRKRIDEVKIQELVLLAKLAQLETKQ
jgi:hypothetical protein